jgi:hypothetical protein
MIKCFRCQKVLILDLKQSIGRRDSCPSCMADIHCCKMCIHWDVNSYNECRESMAERQVEKEKSNFCDYYKLSSSEKLDPNEEKRKQLEKAMALFKK